MSGRTGHRRYQPPRTDTPEEPAAPHADPDDAPDFDEDEDDDEEDDDG